MPIGVGNEVCGLSRYVPNFDKREWSRERAGPFQNCAVDYCPIGRFHTGEQLAVNHQPLADVVVEGASPFPVEHIGPEILLRLRVKRIHGYRRGLGGKVLGKTRKKDHAAEVASRANAHRSCETCSVAASQNFAGQVGEGIGPGVIDKQPRRLQILDRIVFVIANPGIVLGGIRYRPEVRVHHQAECVRHSAEPYILPDHRHAPDVRLVNFWQCAAGFAGRNIGGRKACRIVTGERLIVGRNLLRGHAALGVALKALICGCLRRKRPLIGSLRARRN